MYIFKDLFGERQSDIHRRIVSFLAKQSATYDDISDAVAYPSSGPLTDYLAELIEADFISRDYTWSLKTGKTGKLNKYRLKDNYLRFYLKYIRPRLDQINQQKYLHVSLHTLPEWNTIMGLQFENLLLNNRQLIYKALHIDPMTILQDNPYYQNKTTKQKACQIDYLIQTKYKTLYVCEFKFSKNEISQSIIKEMQDKITRFKPPYGYACIPVILHVGGVQQSVIDAEYFGAIINVCDWFDDFDG